MSLAKAIVRAAAIACSLAAAGPLPAALEHGQQFKDWAVACGKAAPDGDVEGTASQCYIFQNITLKDTRERLLHVAVGHLGGQGRPAAIVTLPLGIYLPPGVSLSVDGGEPIRFAVQQCMSLGCRGVLPLDPATIASMKKGLQAGVTFTDVNGRAITVPVSLIGFTAGYDALSR